MAIAPSNPNYNSLLPSQRSTSGSSGGTAVPIHLSNTCGHCSRSCDCGGRHKQDVDFGLKEPPTHISHRQAGQFSSKIAAHFFTYARPSSYMVEVLFGPFLLRISTWGNALLSGTAYKQVQHPHCWLNSFHEPSTIELPDILFFVSVVSCRPNLARWTVSLAWEGQPVQGISPDPI